LKKYKEEKQQSRRALGKIPLNSVFCFKFKVQSLEFGGAYGRGFPSSLQFFTSARSLIRLMSLGRLS
jgi:hypothetical protein